MTSDRPYLVRAIYEWVVDNDMTPMVVVREEGANHGTSQGKDLYTTYNISPRAVRDLVIDDQSICFDARFHGMGRQVVLDMRKVCHIYCWENDKGVVFPVGDEQPPSPSDEEPTSSKGRSHLQVVK